MRPIRIQKVETVSDGSCAICDEEMNVSIQSVQHAHESCIRRLTRRALGIPASVATSVRTCGDIKVGRPVVVCECGAYRDAGRPHGYRDDA